LSVALQNLTLNPQWGLSPRRSRLLPGAWIPASAGMTDFFEIRLFTRPSSIKGRDYHELPKMRDGSKAKFLGPKELKR
jgi:hypothetical protein